MKHVEVFTLFIILMIAESCLPSARKQKEHYPTKPNIIFIMADDLGYADPGCYGQESIQTPHIDQLAAEGLQFTQCYSGAAVCAPARSVLMTGRHTGHTTVRGNFGRGGVTGLGGGEGRVPLAEEDVTIAQLLQRAGYRTAMVGKWGLGEPHTSGEPNKKGFDEFFGFLNQRRAHSYYPEYIWKDTTRYPLAGNQNGLKKQYTHDLFAEYALDFIKRNAGQPFFLYLPFCIPHEAYEIADLGKYKGKVWNDTLKAYAAMVSRLDSTVGLIMQTLKEVGIEEKTWVFFTSDNGPAHITGNWELFNSNGPLRGGKRDAYEGGIRVPMIVRYPGTVPSGKSSDLVWYFADILPTLADITGIKPPENIDGISVLPTLSGKQQGISDRYLYWEFYEKKGWRATRFGDWKAIQQGMNQAVHQPVELYNLKEDGGEAHDLATQFPELVLKAEQIFGEAHDPSPNFVWKYLLDSIGKQ